VLNTVMQRQPRTVRLILSGHADQELIMKCVGTTHQFLSKPCEPETLKNTIARATSLGFRMQNEKLMAVVARMDRLPSFPAIYADIVQALQDPEVSMERVGDIVSKDIAMTANILKLVNSAFFGLRRQIVNPAEAASYLGVDVLKSLVLSLHAFSECEATQVKGFSVEAEREIFGSTHAEAGGYLLGLWGLPVPVVEARKVPRFKALESLRQCPGRYDPNVLEAVAASFGLALGSESADRPAPRSLALKELQVGHQIINGIQTRDGMLIVPMGTIIAQVHLEKLRNFAELSGIQEPILIAA